MFELKPLSAIGGNWTIVLPLRTSMMRLELTRFRGVCLAGRQGGEPCRKQYKVVRGQSYA